MSFKAALALSTLLGSSTLAAPAIAMTGIGCPDLPEYYRAVGTIENGPGSCGMTTEEAKRILARGENGQGVAQPAAPPVPRKHHRRHKTHHE